MDKTPLRMINMRKLQHQLNALGFRMSDSVLDPLSKFNELWKRVDYQAKVLSVEWHGNPLPIPLDFYWMTDGAEELAQSMAVEFALAYDPHAPTLVPPPIQNVSNLYATVMRPQSSWLKRYPYP